MPTRPSPSYVPIDEAEARSESPGGSQDEEEASPTADKGAQMARETRIRSQGGTYVRDKRTRELVPVEGISEIRRVE